VGADQLGGDVGIRPGLWGSCAPHVAIATQPCLFLTGIPGWFEVCTEWY
jgi:hypothetical protein